MELNDVLEVIRKRLGAAEYDKDQALNQGNTLAFIRASARADELTRLLSQIEENR